MGIEKWLFSIIGVCMGFVIVYQITQRVRVEPKIKSDFPAAQSPGPFGALPSQGRAPASVDSTAPLSDENGARRWEPDPADLAQVKADLNEQLMIEASQKSEERRDHYLTQLRNLSAFLPSQQGVAAKSSESAVKVPGLTWTKRESVADPTQIIYDGGSMVVVKKGDLNVPALEDVYYNAKSNKVGQASHQISIRGVLDAAAVGELESRFGLKLSSYFKEQSLSYFNVVDPSQGQAMVEGLQTYLNKNGSQYQVKYEILYHFVKSN